RFDHGIRETADNGTGIIATDLPTLDRAEAHARDHLLFAVADMDFERYGGDAIFRITRPSDSTLIALPKSGFVFFDYQLGTVAAMPESFRNTFPEANWLD